MGVIKMFNEKTEEWSTKQNKKIPVWQSPKYLESKKKAIEMITDGKYDLTEGDFWILMNETKNGSMGYTGLIISHNGCLKINDKLENKVDPRCFSLDKEGYNNSLTYTYVDDDTYEIGEVSKSNCKNDYPYAMAFKRCFDRVVLKKSKLAYAGIYSDSEADEFKEPLIAELNEIKDNEVIDVIKVKAMQQMCKDNKLTKSELLSVLEDYGYEKIE